MKVRRVSLENLVVAHYVSGAVQSYAGSGKNHEQLKAKDSTSRVCSTTARRPSVRASGRPRTGDQGVPFLR